MAYIVIAVAVGLGQVRRQSSRSGVQSWSGETNLSRWCVAADADGLYIVMAYIVMSYIAMAYIVMAYIVVAYIVMSYVVMAADATAFRLLE